MTKYFLVRANFSFYQTVIIEQIGFTKYFVFSNFKAKDVFVCMNWKWFYTRSIFSSTTNQVQYFLWVKITTRTFYYIILKKCTVKIVSLSLLHDRKMAGKFTKKVLFFSFWPFSFYLDATAFGGHECTWGPAFWCQSKIHAHACGTTQHCEEHVWNN